MSSQTHLQNIWRKTGHKYTEQQTQGVYTLPQQERTDTAGGVCTLCVDIVLSIFAHKLSRP